MSLDLPTMLAILAMAAITYLMRIGGAALLRRVDPGPRLRAALEAVPGCVLVAVVAPAALTRGPADLVATAVTLLAALRMPLVAVVAIGVVTAALARAVLG